MQKIEFHPQRLFATNDYAVILLNQEILLDDEFFLKVWNNAVIRHVVDGGSNHFFSFLDRQPDTVRNSVKYPEIATGDFDSITEESMNRLKDPNLSKCKIIETEDQDNTDFTKALKVLHEEIKSNNGAYATLKTVITICEFTGRLDQMLANLNTLHKNVFLEDSSTDKPNVYIFSTRTLCWLIPANYTSIISFEEETPNFTCAVMPFQSPTRYTSTGLQWNLNTDMVCQFGGLVSTSNKVIAEHVQITPRDNHSIFSLELNVSDYLFVTNSN